MPTNTPKNIPGENPDSQRKQPNYIEGTSNAVSGVLELSKEKQIEMLKFEEERLSVNIDYLSSKVMYSIDNPIPGTNNMIRVEIVERSKALKNIIHEMVGILSDNGDDKSFHDLISDIHTISDSIIKLLGKLPAHETHHEMGLILPKNQTNDPIEGAFAKLSDVEKAFDRVLGWEGDHVHAKMELMNKYSENM